MLWSTCESRRKAFFKAFDIALERVARVESLAAREATLEDAKLAVMASHTSCGPVARAAEAALLAAGVIGVKFQTVGGHYVILDQYSGLIHDLEAPDGCKSKNELPIAARLKKFDLVIEHGATDQIFYEDACAWLLRRKNLIVGSYEP